MRQPENRGAAIDATRIQRWLTRFHGYRLAVTKRRVRKWIGRFRVADADLAARVLDAVEFFTDEDLERILRKIHGRLRQRGWNSDKKGGARWRFVAFGASAGESGDTMLHTFRRANEIRGSRFNQYFPYKAELVAQRLGPEDTVVFFDDISGSGQQAAENSEHLRELLPDGPRILLVLIALSTKARKRIESQTPIRLMCHLELSASDNVFSASCSHFTQAEQHRLLTYCDVANPSAPRGYGDCGFLIVFSHDCPDNSIPVLHANHPRWRGLFPR